jgi:glycosyltransferase involved in cell wall biosynthesis
MRDESASTRLAPSVSAVRFISDLATPHINALLAELRHRPGVELELWYAGETSKGYPEWRNNPTHLVQRANLYGHRVPHPRLIANALSRSHGVCIVVGWANPTTRALLPLLALARRPFLFYTDEPAPVSRPLVKSAIRRGYMDVLRRQAIVLATGRNAVDHFVREGFSAQRVLNAPVPTIVPANLEELRSKRKEVRSRYGLADGDVLFVAGSRLLRSKGFDILLRAVGALEPRERARARVVIVGSGPEDEPLKKLARELGLDGVVSFESWMEFADFEQMFAAADVAIHPSRFDGYGATTLMAAAMGLPAIGTRAAGSAAELIEPGVNGFLYDAEDAQSLAEYLRVFLRDSNRAREMGLEAGRRASRWSPARVADVFVEALQLAH